MITTVFIHTLATIFEIFMFVFSPLFTFVFTLTGIDVVPYIGYVFGNLMAFNTILPVTETLILASASLLWKAFLLGYDIFLFTINWFSFVKRTFIVWR